MLRTLATLVTVVVAAGFVASAPVRAQEPTLAQVLARATQYALDYQKTLSGIVAEESYLQTWIRGAKTRQTRTLKSDVLLTQPQGAKRFLLFRDVFEVDGREVRDRSERLLQLFLSPVAFTSTQITRIVEESARYNIGDIQRTVNTPTLALVLLDPQYQGHFTFDRVDDPVAANVRGVSTAEAAQFTGAPDLWVIAYQETARDTLMSTGPGSPLPANGRFWIEPATGRIVMTELQLRNSSVDAIIDVRYDTAPAVGHFVPVAMRERYRDLRKDSIVEGEASYSRVRKFEVTSSESLKDETR